ncbi:MAG TPA: hypothetical protein VFB80_14745 [Pirellulaceae bacterium]|nr:hypothetical protein [Pirellulaceae bacterium]
MKNIDFLPDIYRQRAALRKARIWWCAVVVLFGGAISSAFTAQVWLRVSLKRQLAALEESFLSSQTQVRELANLQAQIAKSAHEASLFTYLQHPWPRTQLLAQVVRPLPKSIRLTQIHVSDEELPRDAPHAAPLHRGPETEPAAKPQPAEDDLAKLQQEMDFKATIVQLQGFTPEAADLHEYVALLNGSSLIAAAQIKSLESDSTHDPPRTRFTLRLIVHPGYGQRGSEGPPAPPTDGRGQSWTRLRGNGNAPSGGGG